MLVSHCGPWVTHLAPSLNYMKSPRAKKLGLAILLGSLVVRSLVSRVRKNRNKEKSKRKRQEVKARKAALEERLLVEGVLLTPSRNEILALEVGALLAKLKSGDLDVRQVLAAYQAKALVVDRDINAVCDMILEASDWAEDLAILPPAERGPLYGLPVSVKECFYVAGYDCTVGLAQHIGKPLSSDCDFVAALKRLGAIPFCLTNVPQTMLSYACSNPVFGNTANPHDLTRSPGGSSGGEAALIAAGGSILGIGSDVAGSLRIPAHFSGCVGLKPSSSRLFEGGRRQGVGAGSKYLRMGIYSVAGFMAPTVGGIEVGMRALLSAPELMSREDWRVVPLPWREEEFSPKRKLRIGYYTDDGIFPPTPGMVRAVDEVVALLKKDGHEVISWTPPDLRGIFDVFVDILLSDKGYFFLQAMQYEEIDQAIEVNALNYRSPATLKKVMSFFFRFVSKKLSLIWASGKELTRDQWILNATKDKLIYQLTKAWEDSHLDVVICPAFAMPACPPSYCSRILPAASYTCVYNLVGCPAGIVPVTKETAEDQSRLSSYPVSSDLLHRVARNVTKGAEGCPIGVQVVGRHFKDELVLHAMGEVERLSRAATL